MSVTALQEQLNAVIEFADGRALDATLEADLNTRFGADSDAFTALVKTCRTGVEEGWLCNREGGGIKFGRAIKPGPETHGFSVDVVEMDDIVGPYHAHPNGEIDLIMPEDGDAKFDGAGAGWMVYGPGTEHAPTVAGGKALVLYLLPDGAIEFKSK